MVTVTIQQKFVLMLQNHGLFRDQAEKVMLECRENQDLFPNMSNRWDHSIDDYPAFFTTALWMGVKETAIEWGKENAPKAWWILHFSGGDPADA